MAILSLKELLINWANHLRLVCLYVYPTVRGRSVWKHNTILSCWGDWLDELQICHHREPRNRYAETEDRPDIVFFDLESGHDVDLDISLAHPWSLDTIRQAGERNGYDDS